jgi:hypothetical protein
MSRNAGALVIGYRREDERRFVQVRAAALRPRYVRHPSGAIVPLAGVVKRETSDLDCTIDAGRCISCGHAVYLNSLGYSAVLEKDADVACMECEDRYAAELTRSL